MEVVGSIANHDSASTGPHGALRVGRQVVYPVDRMAEWLIGRMWRCGMARNPEIDSINMDILRIEVLGRFRQRLSDVDMKPIGKHYAEMVKRGLLTQDEAFDLAVRGIETDLMRL